MGKKLYRSGDVLSITISPAPHRQYLKERYKERRNMMDTEWVKIFYEWYRLCGIKQIQLWREISWNGLLHYHGVVTIDDPREFATIIGELKYPTRGASDVSIDIDTINSMDIWLDYCVKDKEVMGDCLIIPLNGPVMEPKKENNKNISNGSQGSLNPCPPCGRETIEKPVYFQFYTKKQITSQR